MLAAWINAHGINVLNEAGARASKDPEIYDRVRVVIQVAVEAIQEQETWVGVPPGETVH